MDSNAEDDVSPGEAAPETVALVPAFQPASLLLPPVVTLSILLIVFVSYGPHAAVEMLVKGVAALGLGKFAVLVLPDDRFFSEPWQIALMVVYLDVLLAIPLVWNVHHLHRLPRIGRRLHEFTSFGRLVLTRNPWMAKATFLGVVAFVTFPLSGTGSVGGAILGRILGMSRRKTMIAIVCGSVVGAFGMAALAEQLLRLLGHDFYRGWSFKVGGALTILLLVGWLTRRYKRVAEAMGGRDPDPPAGS